MLLGKACGEPPHPQRTRQWLKVHQATQGQGQGLPHTRPGARLYIAPLPKGPESHFPTPSQATPGPLPITSQVNAMVKHRRQARMPLKFRARGCHEPQPTTPVSSCFPRKKHLLQAHRPSVRSPRSRTGSKQKYKARDERRTFHHFFPLLLLFLTPH